MREIYDKHLNKAHYIMIKKKVLKTPLNMPQKMRKFLEKKTDNLKLSKKQRDVKKQKYL